MIIRYSGTIFVRGPRDHQARRILVTIDRRGDVQWLENYNLLHGIYVHIQIGRIYVTPIICLKCINSQHQYVI